MQTCWSPISATCEAWLIESLGTQGAPRKYITIESGQRWQPMNGARSSGGQRTLEAVRCSASIRHAHPRGLRDTVPAGTPRLRHRVEGSWAGVPPSGERWEHSWGSACVCQHPCAPKARRPHVVIAEHVTVGWPLRGMALAAMPRVRPPYHAPGRRGRGAPPR
jgi:hypothetical protein